MSKKIIFGFVLLVILVLLSMGCTNSFLVGTGSDSASLSGSINDVLSSLPEVTLKLPRSLGGEDTTDGARSVSRALGDVSTINLGNLKVLRTERWRQLREPDMFVNIVNRYFLRIKNQAQNQSIALNDLILIDITLEDLEAVFPEASADLSQFTVDGYSRFAVIERTDDLLTLEGSLNIIIGYSMYEGESSGDSFTMTLQVPFVISYSTSSGEPLVELTARASFESEDVIDGVTTSYADVYDMYTQVNAATGALDSVGYVRPNLNSSTDGGLFYSSVRPQGSTIGLINASGTYNGFFEPEFFYLGYGNDTLGAVGYSSEYQYQILNSNNEWEWSTDTVKNASREVFDSNGSLLYTQWGSEHSYQAEWLRQRLVDASNNVGTTTINLANYLDASISSPETFRVVLTRDNGQSGWNSVTIESDEFASILLIGDAIAPFLSSWFELYFVASDDPATIQSGDSSYYTATLETFETTKEITYRRAWVVPDFQSVFGVDIYMDTSYPLVNLLPLTDPTMTLMQKEGDTSTWDWTDWEGNLQTSSYTWYEYWVEAGGDPQVFDPADGDINLSDKMQLSDYWEWDQTTSDWKQTKVYEYRTPTQLPSFFQDPADSASVQSVLTSLDSLAQSAKGVSVTPYLQVIDQVLGSDLSRFEKYF